jgi:hypothetical protein
MRNLHVTVWQINTHAMQYLDLNSRLAHLYKAVDQAYQHLRALPPRKHKLRGVFIAPEYYFAKQAAGGIHQLNEERYLSEEDEYDISSSLACLSKLYPGLLIIPGTIAWSSPTSARHSVFAYLNGLQVYQSHRSDDFDETAHSLPEFNTAPVFECDGVRFGIEIFLDHAYGVLKKPVDIHIILSTCVRRQGGKGKYVIYVSHQASETSTWKLEDGEYQKSNSHETHQSMGCDKLAI